MTDIYEGYLSPEERKAAIADAKLDVLFERCNMMYEMVQLQYKQNVREAELKVLTEGGTYDDLAYLIEEAGEDAADKKKGLIGTLIDGIISLFKKIGESIRNIVVKDGVEVEADEGIMSGVNNFDKIFSIVERTFSGGIVQGFLKTAGIVEACRQMWGLLTSIPEASGKMRKYASDGVNKAREILEKISKWITEKLGADRSKIDGMSPEQLDEDKGEGWSIRKILDFFKNMGAKVKTRVDYIIDILKKGNGSGGDSTKKAIKDDIQYAKGGWVKGSDGKYTKDESKIPGSSAAYLDSEGYKSILTNAGVAEGDARKEYDEYAKQTFQDQNVGPKDPPQENGGNATPEEKKDGQPNAQGEANTPNQSNSSANPDNPAKPNDGSGSTPESGNPYKPTNTVDKLTDDEKAQYTNLQNKYKNARKENTKAAAKDKLQKFERSHSLPLTESALDDYIDELESTIYENSMSDYEYHSLVSAIDALF